MKKKSKKREKSPRLYSCPHCRACDKFRVHHPKNFKDYAMILLGLRRIVCVRCLNGFYGWPYGIKPQQRSPIKIKSKATT